MPEDGREFSSGVLLPPAIGLLNTTFRRPLLLNVKPARMSVKGPSFRVETSYSIKAIVGNSVVEMLVYTFSAVLLKFISEV